MKQISTIIALLAASLCANAADTTRLIPRWSYITNEKTTEIIVQTPNSHQTVEISIDNLKIGKNTVTLDIDGKQHSVDIERLAPKANAVRIDRLTGLIHTDGLPFVACGFYCYSPIQKQLIDQEVVRGMNLYSPYQKVEGKTLKERLWYMDRCAEVGMKVNYNLLSVAGGGGVGGNAHKNTSADEKYKMLDNEIRAIKDHPALLSWYIADEPEGQGINPETLEEIYARIKAIDPYHPIAVVIMSAGPGRTYANSCDIIMCDTYPVPNSSPNGVIDAVQGLYDELKFEKAIWYVPQTFGGSEWWSREPNPAEIRMMTWGAALAGARGNQAFIRHGLNGFPKNQSTWDAYTEACRQIELLAPKFDYGQPIKIAGSNNIFGKRYGDVIVVVNRENKPAQFSTYAGATAYEMFANYTPELFEGVLTDYIAPYGVNIYTTSDKHPAINPSNQHIDASFEDPYSVSSQQPASCYASVGKDPAASYMLDARQAYHGLYSLRLINPSQGKGCSLGFTPMPLTAGKNYILTIWAKTDQRSIELNPKGVKFKVNLGGFAEREFELTTQWKQYTINAPFTTAVSDARSVSSSLELISGGVAWFDLMEVVPDMDFTISRHGNIFHVAMNCHVDRGTIHFTTDGSDPLETSPQYTDTLQIDKVTTLKARLFKDGVGYGISEQLIAAHKALGAKVQYLQPYTQYTGRGDGALTDGAVAELRYLSTPWQGFINNDMEVVLDLGKPTNVRKISSQYFHSPSDWIAPPVSVEYSVSLDGVPFRSLGIEDLGQAKQQPACKIVVSKELDGESVRYIKIKAIGHHRMPAWHIGGDAWLFCDEVIVE